MLAAMQRHTHCGPTANNALMGWIVRHAAWLIRRFRGSDVQSPFCRAMGGPYRGKLVKFGETVVAHLPEVGKGSGNPAPKLADRWKSDGGLGKSDLTDKHLVRTNVGVVYVRSVRRLAENSWSEENLKSVIETPQKHKSTTTDDAAIPEQYQKYMNTRTRMKKRTRMMVTTKNHPTSQTVRIVTWRERRFRRQTQQRRRARAEERCAQKHKRMCS